MSPSYNGYCLIELWVKNKCEYSISDTKLSPAQLDFELNGLGVHIFSTSIPPLIFFFFFFFVFQSAIFFFYVCLFFAADKNIAPADEMEAGMFFTFLCNFASCCFFFLLIS